jgi:ribonuclease BN (tRNA processing enzyme)
LPEDYPPRRGWGHSTFEDGIALSKAANCKKMIFSHICQDYSDDVLNAVKGKFDASKYMIAYDGMELDI